MKKFGQRSIDFLAPKQWTRIQNWVLLIFERKKNFNGLVLAINIFWPHSENLYHKLKKQKLFQSTSKDSKRPSNWTIKNPITNFEHRIKILNNPAEPKLWQVQQNPIRNFQNPFKRVESVANPGRIQKNSFKYNKNLNRTQLAWRELVDVQKLSILQNYY